MARRKEFDPEERMEKARDLFWEKGYNATSMEDLVQTMGLNRGSIYDTYGDKHSLYLQCLGNYAAEKLREHKEAALGTSPIEKVENMILSVVEATVNTGKCCMAVNSTFELATVDQSVHSIINNNWKDIVNFFEQLLTDAKKVGEISQDKDPRLLAEFIAANFTGLWQTYILSRDKKQVEKLAQFLIDMIKH
ncbi:TetR/AcrR family transcriptional regulator [Dyadobacter sp. LHD-138]|uniref:TetR/AcrR family transcriptional regulator n=1 Tax=Dyadobacter sp. LHD-138 TaxID=3071413 RepID=UPI0027DEE458|nr:TetR/AcrR family transcriptional regulator [Dyadobacter sp. LHD-138]MDQ6478857.1 TetR/AcrR family transcriptional regulator [Dyadobacter sp. LHD-138]